MLQTDFFKKISKAFSVLPDLKDPNEDVDVMVKVEGYFEAPII